MKISNGSKIMLIVAMALAGNAAYRALQNRTSCSSASECQLPENCCATACQECINEGVSPEAFAAAPVDVSGEQAPALETAMYSDSDDDESSAMQRAMQAEKDEEEDDEENEEEDSNDGMGENDIP